MNKIGDSVGGNSKYITAFPWVDELITAACITQMVVANCLSEWAVVLQFACH